MSNLSENDPMASSTPVELVGNMPQAADGKQRLSAAAPKAKRALRPPGLALVFGAQRRLTSPSARSRLEQTVPHEAFLTDLHREKRRAERSHSPLSMALYRVDGSSAESARQADRLVELLYREKRVTDFIGHVGNDMVAVLCTDTDGAGMTGFMKKVEAKAGPLSFVAVAATYPDDLFNCMDNGTPAPRDLQPFISAEPMDGHDRGYPLKRALDIVGSLVALCLLSPLMLLVAAAVALSSRGPVIFKQTRVGKGGFPFAFYKFRSMRTDADDAIHREFVSSLIKSGADAGHADNTQGAFKIKADPRVTPVGRFIRRTSIDELPQLFNVLKGDMSLVGPRPPIPYEATHYQPWHLRRLLSVKPGMTGIWQVEGRSRVPFNEMVRMDLRYIRECSLGLDIAILLKTVVVVLRGYGAD